MVREGASSLFQNVRSMAIAGIIRAFVFEDGTVAHTGMWTDRGYFSAHEIDAFSNVRKLVLGASHVCALMNDGRVRCAGRNGYGQLGDGTTFYRATPGLVLL